MLTGRPAFRAASFAQTLHQVLDDEPVSVRTLQPQLSRDLETICMKCLQKDPQKRYVSAALLADDLDRFLAGLTIHARPISVWQRTWRWSRRHRAAAALIGSVASFLLLTSTFLVWHSQTLAREEANARRNADMALDIAVEFERAADQMAFLPETKNLAQGLYERALQPVAELVARSPDNVKPRQILARLKERLAIHYSEAGEVEKAEMFIASAYEIIDGLFVEQPSAEHRAKRAEISRAYGQVLARRQEFSKALSMLDSSIADVQQLVADEPAQVNHQYRTAQMLLTRGDIRWSQLKGRPFDQQLFAAAERDLIEADSHAKKLSDGGQLEPLASDLRGEILSVLVSLYAFRSRSQPDGEWELRTANGFEEMVTLYKQLRQQYPKTAKYRELLVQAYRERAEWMNDIHPAEATPFLETLIQNAEALATDKPELLRNRLLLIGDRQKLADRILIDSDSRLESGQALVEDRIRQVLRLVRLSRELSQQLAEALQVQADDLYKPADRVGTELWAYALLGEFDQAELLSGEFEELADSGLASHLVSASNFAYFDFLIDRLPTVNPADLTDRRHIWKTKAVESLRKAAAHAGFHIKMVRNDQYLARLQEFPPMQELLTELELREKSVVPTESTSVPQ